MIQQAARIAAMPTSEDENLTTIAANHGNNGYSYQPGVMTNQDHQDEARDHSFSTMSSHSNSNNSSNSNQSYFGLHEMEELLMEAGFSSTALATRGSNNKMIHETPSSDQSWLQAKKQEQRFRTSSSFSESLFQQQQELQEDAALVIAGDEDDEELEESSVTFHTTASFTTDQHEGEEPAAASTTLVQDLIRAQFLPAPDGKALGHNTTTASHVSVVDDDSDEETTAESELPKGSSHSQKHKSKNKKHKRDEAEEEQNIPVVALSNLQLLAAKIPKQTSISTEPPTQATPTAPTRDVEAAAIDARSIMTMSTMSQQDFGSDDGEHPIASVQSLISVVAELIRMPIRAVVAALEELDQEIFASTSPTFVDAATRPEFTSASILFPTLQEDDNNIDDSQQDDEHNQDNNNNDNVANDIDLEQQSLPADDDNNNNSHNKVPLGLRLDRVSMSGTDGKDKASLVITDIDRQGLWASSPLSVGDRIISLNHVQVSDWHVQAFVEHWDQLTTNKNDNNNDNIATIIAHNPQGDAQWIQAMVTKPDPSTRTGIGMRSSRPGRVKISRVNGLFAHSILNAGDQILSINGTFLDGYNSAEAADLIISSPRSVSIVAKSGSKAAFVIASSKDVSTSHDTGVSSATTNGEAALANVEGDAIDRDGIPQDTDPFERLDHCGTTLRGPWTAIQMLQVIGDFYILAALGIGLYVTLVHDATLSLIVAVLMVAILMKIMMHTTIRQLSKHDKEGNHQRCSVLQVSSNIILLTALTLLLLFWGSLHYTVVTEQLVMAILMIVILPMMIFINLPCLAPKPFQIGDENDDENADLEESLDVGEPEAVASLAAIP